MIATGKPFPAFNWKVDCEPMSLVVSAIAGYGIGIDAYGHEVIKDGISVQGVQPSIRIASVLNAAARAVFIEDVNRSTNTATAA